MQRVAVLLYGVASYALFLVVFLYLIGFSADLVVPVSVSSGEPGPPATALGIDLALIALFGVQHTVMARSSFKAWWTQWVPRAVERSTFVMATNLVLACLFLWWRPLPGVIWEVDSPAAVAAIRGTWAAGWLLVLVSTFLTNHFDLFGLRQVWLYFTGTPYTPVGFREILFYRWIRHPMMLGLLLGVWAAPRMTASHLLFSVGMSAYILVGIHFEEAGLLEHLGERYRAYQQRTWRLLPFY